MRTKGSKPRKGACRTVHPDSWAARVDFGGGSDKGYSTSEFYPRKDEKGSVAVSVRIPLLWHTALTQLVASRIFPFRTLSDVVKYALYVAMQRMIQLDSRVPSILKVLVATDDMLARREIESELKRQIQHMATTAEELLKEAELEEAQAVVRSALEIASSLDEDDEWRKRYEKSIRQDPVLGKILKGMQ